MSLVNETTLEEIEGKWVVSREVAKNSVPTLVSDTLVSKGLLDVIQANLGTRQTPDPVWNSWSNAERQETLRKAVVVLSEIAEKQLKMLIFLVGDKLD